MSNYHVDFQNMYFAYYQMMNNSGSRCQALEDLQKAIEGFNGWNESFTGMSAEALKLYFQNIHFPIIAGIGLLCSTHMDLYKQYLSDYCFRVDGDGSFSSNGGDKRAVFDAQELEFLSRAYGEFMQKTAYTEGQVSDTLRRISDLFSYSRSDNEPELEYNHEDTIDFINDVHDNVEMVEREHVYADFAETSQMISNLNSLINEVFSKNRDFKSNFSEKSLMEIASTYNKFGEAFVALAEKEEAIDQVKLDAFDGANQRFIDEYKEEERRQKKAEKWRWIGIGAGVVIGVAAIVVSGGTMTPVVAAVAGGLAAGTAAFCNEVADNIIKNGSEFGGMDWKHLAGRVVVEAGIGAIAGYAGGFVGEKLGDIKWIADGIKVSNNNIIKKVGANVVKELGTEIVKSPTKRVLGNFEDVVVDGKTRDIRSVLFDQSNDHSLFNIKEIGKDVVDGTASGIVKGVVTGNIDTNKLNKPGRVIWEGGKGIINETIPGIGSRAAKSVIEQSLVYNDLSIDEHGIPQGVDLSQIDGDKVFSDTFDPKETVKDITKGFSEGAAKAMVEVKAQDINDENVEKYKTDDIQNPKKWLESGGKIKRTISGKVIYEEKQVYNTPKSKVGTVQYKDGHEVGRKYINSENISPYGGHFRRTPLTSG